MNIAKYLFKMRGLMNLKRYQNLFLFKERSVAEHSWSVAKIAHSLALIERKKYGTNVDIAFLLQKAIFHDSIEVYTGDILSMSKRRTPSMKKAVATLEKRVYEEEFSSILPNDWREEFRSYTLDAKDDTIEGKLLHASDVIDTLFEAVEEIKLGNKEYFLDVLQNSLEKLLDNPLNSVQDFLKNFIQYLEDIKFNLKEHYGEEFYQTIENWKLSKVA